MTEREPIHWRFLNTRFGNAFFNMAVDEAVLGAVRRGTAPPTLRVFAWTPPAISFGYAQRVSQEVELDRCRALGVDTVRRPTGGRAVLHWNELTYSVVCPSDDPSLGGGVLEAYRKISDCLVNGLLHLGVDARFESRRQPSPSPRVREVTSPCFSSTSQYEVTIQGRKLIGSAQRRIEGVLLQHGSLLIGPEHRRIVELLPRGRNGLRERFERELDRQTTSLEETLGRRISFEEVAEALRTGFREAADLPTIEAPLSPEEATEAERLVRDKYATDSWNLGDRETDLAATR